jgi:hypothetical protein
MNSTSTTSASRGDATKSSLWARSKGLFSAKKNKKDDDDDNDDIQGGLGATAFVRSMFPAFNGKYDGELASA